MTTWAGFPMGFRFTVDDYSCETKRKCWQLLLSSLGCGKYAQVLLFERETTAEYDSDQKLYVCILSHKPIKQSRANAKHFLADTRLLSALSVYAPIVMENSLNPDGTNTALIGLVKVNGEIVTEEIGKDFLPEVIPQRKLPMTYNTVLVAPDSMKGMFASSVLTQRISAVISDADGDYRPLLLPIGDGGEGTVLSLASGTRGRMIPTVGRDVRGDTVSAAFAVLPDGTAAIECASVVGYAQKGTTDIMHRSSAGVGDLILHALGYGYSKLYVCVGGTSTSDCGIGMLSALGFRFYDASDSLLTPLAESLARVFRVDCSDVPDTVKNAQITVLSDSHNPLCGQSGAVRVYAPQKGATDDDLETLEHGFLRFSEILPCVNGRTVDADSGAGGGIAFALARAFGASIVSGIDRVLEQIGFDNLLRSAAAVITAEGSFDEQSIHFGKATKAIIDRCERTKTPCFLLHGRASDAAKKWVRDNCHYTTLCPCDCSNGDKSELLKECIADMTRRLPRQ